MKSPLYLIATSILFFSSFGCDSYEPRLETPFWQHRVHRKQNKLRRSGLAIEKRGEEPSYHELDPFPPTMSWFASTKLMQKTPRRILVMPVTNPWDNPKISKNVTRIFNRELLKGGFSDIISLQDVRPENQCILWPWSKWPDPMRVGRIQYPELVEAAERFQVNAVLYSQVTIHKQTEPPNFGIKAMLVEIGTPPWCDVIWSIDAVFDAGDLEIWDRAKQYYVQRTAKHWSRDDVTRMEPYGGTRHYGHRLMLMSNDRYLEYCSYEIVKNLRIASLGLRWPHYRYEKDVSPKKKIRTYDLVELELQRAKEDEEAEARKEQLVKKTPWWKPWKKRKVPADGGSRKRVYPPQLYLPQQISESTISEEPAQYEPQSSTSSSQALRPVSNY